MGNRKNTTSETGIFLISFSLLSLQVALTRVFSVLFWYHFSFLVISLALLGFTGGGLLLFLFEKRIKHKSSKYLWLSSLMFGLTSLMLVPILTNIPLRMKLLESVYSLLPHLLIFVIIVLIPFIFAGLAISLALDVTQDKINRMYFANLTGSGVGCWIILLVLDHLGGGSAGVIFSSCIAILASIVYSLKQKRIRILSSLSALILVIISYSAKDTLFWVNNHKFYPNIEKKDILLRRWDSLSCVDVFKNPMHYGLWALSDKYTGKKPEQLGVVIDSWAATSIIKVDGVNKPPDRDEILPYKNEIFDYLPASFAYSLVKPKKALIIGAGGGIDVLAALNYDVEDITAVDINPLIVKVVKEDYNKYSGYIYHHPRVGVYIAEGRHFLEMQRNTKYDLIQLSGVDTYTASQAGAFALTENYIYTNEAFMSYLEHLRDGGLLTMTRWLFTPPRHTLRLCVIAYNALKQKGNEKPEDNIAIIANGIFTVILISNKGFTDDDAMQMRLSCLEKNFLPLYLPHSPSYCHNNAYYRYFDSGDKEEYIRQYPYDISNCTDDKPFFFEHEKWCNLYKSKHLFFNKTCGQMLLLITLLSVLLIGAVFIVIPRVLRRVRLGSLSQVYFISLGLGFIMIETLLIQRFVLFLGHPVYALSVILSVLLISSGIGSLLSGRMNITLRRKLLLSLGLIIIMSFVYAYLLTPLFNSFLYASLPFRILITILLLIPLGMFMGVPFPTGITALRGRLNKGDKEQAEVLLPHAWLLNAYASVLGSVLCLILAMILGFRSVIIIAGFIYLIALLCSSSLDKAQA